MARTAISNLEVLDSEWSSELHAAVENGDAANGNTYGPLDGSDFLLMKNNSGGAAQSLTVDSAPDLDGRTGDVTLTSIANQDFGLVWLAPTDAWGYNSGEAADATEVGYARTLDPGTTKQSINLKLPGIRCGLDN